MNEITVHAQVPRYDTGQPEVSFTKHDGMLQLYPTGVSNGVVLFITVDDWRALNAYVEAHIAEVAA